MNSQFPIRNRDSGTFPMNTWKKLFSRWKYSHGTSPYLRCTRGPGVWAAGVRPFDWARLFPGRPPPWTESRRTLCRRRTWPPCRCVPNRFPTWLWSAGVATASCSGTGPCDASSGASRTAGAPSPRPLLQTNGVPEPVPPSASPAIRTGWAHSCSAATVVHTTAFLSCTPAVNGKRNTVVSFQIVSKPDFFLQRWFYYRF